MGRLMFSLVVLVVIALVVTIGFQVHSLLTAESVGAIDGDPVVQLPGSTRGAIDSGESAAVADATVSDTVGEPVVATPMPVVDVAPVARRAIGRVSLAVGDVTADTSETELRSLRIDSTIYLHDTIACGEASKAKLLFDDGTVLWLSESSELVLDEYTYKPDDKEENGSVFRFVKGMCRMVTGAITSLNPKGFKVKMRVATVGIRGCETGFEADDEQAAIYVLGLGETESVVINTTTDGSPVMDPYTGEMLMVDDSLRNQIAVDEPGFSVTVTVGKGAEMRHMGTEEIRQFMRQTTHMPPASYDLLQKSDGATVRLRPQSGIPSQGQNTSR